MPQSMRMEGSRRGTYPMLNLTGTKHLHRVFDAHFTVEQQKFICEEKRALSGRVSHALPGLIGLSTLQSAVSMNDAEYLTSSGGKGLLSHLALTCATSNHTDTPHTTEDGAAQLYSMTMLHLFKENLLRRSGDRGDVVSVAPSVGEQSGMPLQRDWQRLRKELLVGSGGDLSNRDGGRGGVWFGQQMANPATGRYHYVVRNRWPPGSCPPSQWDSSVSTLPPQFQPFFPAPAQDGPEGTLQPAILCAAQEDVGSMAQLFLADDVNELQYLISSNDDKKRRLTRLVGSLPNVLVSELTDEIAGCERELHFREQLVRLLTLLFRRFMVPATTHHWSQLLNGFLLSNSDPASLEGRVLDTEEVQFLLGFTLERIAQMEAGVSTSSFTIEHQEELYQVASDLQTLYPSVSSPPLFEPRLVPTTNNTLSSTGVKKMPHPTAQTSSSPDTADSVRRMITRNAAQLEVLPPNMQLRRVAEFVKGSAVEERMQEVRYALLNTTRVLLRSILGLYAPNMATPSTTNNLHWSQRNLLLLGCYHTVRCGYYSWPSVAYLHRFSVTIEQIPNTKLTTAADMAASLPPVKESADGKSIKDRLNGYIEALVLASGYVGDAPSSPPGTGTARPSSNQPSPPVATPAPVDSFFRYVQKTDFTTVEALTAWGVCTGAVDPPQLSPLSISSLFPDTTIQPPPPSYMGVLDTLLEWVSSLPTDVVDNGGASVRDVPSLPTPPGAVLTTTPSAVASSPPPKALAGKRQVGKKEEAGSTTIGGHDSNLAEYISALTGALHQSAAHGSFRSRDVCDPFRSVPEGSHEGSLLQLIDTFLGHLSNAHKDVPPTATPTAASPASPSKRGGKSDTSKEAIEQGNGLMLSPRPQTGASVAAATSSSISTIAPDCLLRRPFTAPIVSSLTAVMEVVGHPSYNAASQAARLGEVPPPLYSLVGPLVQVCGSSSNPILPPRRRHVLSSRLQGSTDTGLASKTGYWLVCELLSHSAHFTLTPPVNIDASPDAHPGSISLLRMLRSPEAPLVVTPTPIPAGCPIVSMQGELVGLAALPVTSRGESYVSLLRLLGVVAESGEVGLADSILEGLMGLADQEPSNASHVETLCTLYYSSRRNVSGTTGPSHRTTAEDRLSHLRMLLAGLCEEWEEESAQGCSGQGNASLLGLFISETADESFEDTQPSSSSPTPVEALSTSSPDAIVAASPPQLRGVLAAVLAPLAALHQELVDKAVEESIIKESTSGDSLSPSSPSSPTTAQPPVRIPTPAAPTVTAPPPSPAALLRSELVAEAMAVQRRLVLNLIRSRCPLPAARETVAKSITNAICAHAEEASASLKLLRSGVVVDARAQSKLLLSIAGRVNSVLLTLQLYWRTVAMEVAVGTSLRVTHCYNANQY